MIRVVKDRRQSQTTVEKNIKLPSHAAAARINVIYQQVDIPNT